MKKEIRIKKSLYAVMTGAVLLAAMILILLGRPDISAYAGDHPRWQAGTRAEGYIDYFEENNIWYLITKKAENGKNGEVYAAGCRSFVEKLVIPGTVEHSRKKYNVIGINDHAFSGEKAIKSLDIKDGVRYIGEKAFTRCEGLEKISFASTIDEVGEHAFEECRALKSVTTPQYLKEIPADMFSTCYNLENVVIGKKTKIIGKDAFFDCKALKTVKLDNALTTIDEGAFMRCFALESIKFPSKITFIGKEAFSECKSLKKVTLPKKLKVISEKCFTECESLEKVKLPAYVEEIGAGAFSRCGNLVSVSGTNKYLRIIGDDAFKFCSKLPSFPGSNGKLTTVGAYAFSECKALKKFSFGNLISEIGQCAFAGTSISDVNLTDSLKTMGESAFAGCRSLKEIEIPGSVKIISQSAFAGCYHLEKVTINKGIERIEQAAFQRCYSMREFNYPKTIHYVGMYAFDSTEWLNSQIGYQVTTVDENGKFGYKYAYPGNTDYSWYKEFVCINDVCIWATQFTVRANQNGTYSLVYKDSVVFPSNVKYVSCHINGDRHIQKIVLPEGVTRFDGEMLLDHEFDSSNLSLPSSLTVFEGRIHGEGFTHITLPENLEVLGYGAFAADDNQNLKEVVFTGNKLKVIGSMAFRKTTSLKSIVIPEGVEMIEESAFNSSGLEKVTLPSTLNIIGEYAFCHCPLKEVSLSKGLTEIRKGAFEDTDLTSVKIPDTVRKIGIFAFKDTGIKKYTLPNKFIIEEDFSYEKELTLYVKKNSAAHKALEKFIKDKYLDGWKIKFK